MLQLLNAIDSKILRDLSGISLLKGSREIFSPVAVGFSSPGGSGSTRHSTYQGLSCW